MCFTDEDLKTIQERINAKTIQLSNGCHRWEGSFSRLNGHSYYYVCHKGKRVYVPRFNYIQKHGESYGNRNIRVKKICKGDLCVNPDHHSDKRPEALEETWKRILKHTVTEGDRDCIIFTGSLGCSSIDGVTYRAHIISFMINKNNGESIIRKDSDGNTIVVRHTCPTKFCINPDHLELGTSFQNNFDDKIRDGTICRGEKNHACKITEYLAKKIKLSKFEKWEEGYKTQKERANHFNVSKSIIRDIDICATWAHLPDRYGKSRESSDRRIKVRARRKKANERIWSTEDYENFITKIKTMVEYTNDYKKDINIKGFCWNWKGHLNNDGYGLTDFLGKTIFTHVGACESRYERRKMKQENEITRHLCGNRSCCNPEHVEFGTQYQNNIDTLKHRSNKRLKFEDQDIIDIRNSSDTNVELAKKHRCSPYSISRIKNLKSWKHVV